MKFDELIKKKKRFIPNKKNYVYYLIYVMIIVTTLQNKPLSILLYRSINDTHT